MITLTFPRQFSEDFVQLIPKQRAQVLRMLTSGKLASFSLSMERSNAWMVMNARSEDDVEDSLETFPMYEFFDFDIVELAMHDVQHMGLPQLMMN